ncbi:MAG TPA: L-histidine N(alpha)-methyltransferase [Cellvibrionaceae bacterium]
MLNTSSCQMESPIFSGNPQFLQDVINGLGQPQKSLSPKYFYDTAGSHYFDEICQLPEYYPYRSELQLLPKITPELNDLTPSGTSIIEFGAGALTKIRLLLAGMTNLESFIPIDIAEDFLHQQCRDLQAEYPHLKVQPIAGDFCCPLELPHRNLQSVLGFFPGSTIGNFAPEQARDFLHNARLTLGSDSYFLVGVDTKKSADILHSAYNDSAGVTAKFNLNILARINRELAGNFDVNNFEHYAFYNVSEGRIEMHIISRKNQRVQIAGETFSFHKGESIHTECSYKYTPPEFIALAQSAGWQPQTLWMAEGDAFSIHLLKAADDYSSGLLQ